jgi:hypothetical protein
MSRAERRALIECENPTLPITQQCDRAVVGREAHAVHQDLYCCGNPRDSVWARPDAQRSALTKECLR